MLVFFRGNSTQCRRVMYQMLKRGFVFNHDLSDGGIGVYNDKRSKEIGIKLQGVIVNISDARMLPLNHPGSPGSFPVIYNKDRKRLLELIDRAI